MSFKDTSPLWSYTRHWCLNLKVLKIFLAGNKTCFLLKGGSQHRSYWGEEEKKHWTTGPIHDLNETIRINQLDFLRLHRKNSFDCVGFRRLWYIKKQTLGTNYDWLWSLKATHTRSSSVDTGTSGLSRVISLIGRVDRLTSTKEVLQDSRIKKKNTTLLNLQVAYQVEAFHPSQSPTAITQQKGNASSQWAISVSKARSHDTHTLPWVWMRSFWKSWLEAAKQIFYWFPGPRWISWLFSLV